MKRRRRAEQKTVTTAVANGAPKGERGQGAAGDATKVPVLSAAAKTRLNSIRRANGNLSKKPSWSAK
jgi:hypothetical protein